MEHLKQYPEEFIKPLLLSLDTMSRINVRFFSKSESFLKTNWRFFYTIPMLLIHYTATTSYIVRIFREGTTVSELAFSVPVFLIIIQAFLKAAIVIPKKEHIAHLIQDLGKNWITLNLNERQIKKKGADLKKLNIVLGVYYWGSIIPSWQVMLTPAFLTLLKFCLSQDIQFLLPFGYVCPFDPVKNWLRYIEMYIFQVLSMLQIVYIYIGTEMLMVALCALLSIEFAMLREEFCHVRSKTQNYLDCKERCVRKYYTVEELIRKHQNLLKLSNQLDDIFNKLVFVDLLFVTVIMCFFGFGMTVAHGILDVVNNFIAVLALLLPTFIFCYYGEQLKEESSGIAVSAYTNKWYHANASYQKIICFVIKRAQTPCCLTSLKHTPISLNTFSKVVSTTWSYFSLITSVYGKD